MSSPAVAVGLAQFPSVAPGVRTQGRGAICFGLKQNLPRDTDRCSDLRPETSNTTLSMPSKVSLSCLSLPAIDQSHIFPAQTVYYCLHMGNYILKEKQNMLMDCIPIPKKDIS